NFGKRVAHILEGFHKPDVHVHLTIDDQTLQRRVEGRGEQPLSDEESRFLLTVKGLIRETQAEFNGIEVEVSQTGLVETSSRIIDAIKTVLNQSPRKEC